MIIWKLNGFESFRGHNSRMARPIKLSSKNGIIRQSSGVIHTLDVKNRFTSNRVTRDTKLGFKNLTTLKGQVLQKKSKGKFFRWMEFLIIIYYSWSV
jgi:hypothetical protein